MLKTIERATKHKITVEKIPTVADLRERRLDLTRAALRESLLGDALDSFRVVVESLAEEFDVMEVALAAVNLAHAAIGGSEDGEDIPDVAVSVPTKERARSGRPNRSRRATAGAGPGTTRLYISLGREAGLRPQDLVGAITGETRLSGRNIGAIEISGRFSLVDVPEGRRRRGDQVVIRRQNPGKTSHGPPGALLSR